MQSCGVFFKKNSFYVVSQSFTTFEIAVSIGPMFKVETTLPRDIGEAVIAALNASRSDIPQPDNMAQVQKELFRFTSSRNWSDLAKTAAYVAVRRNDSTVTIEPHKAGSGGAFVPDGPGVPCSNEDVEGIGRAVLNALKVEPGA